MSNEDGKTQGDGHGATDPRSADQPASREGTDASKQSSGEPGSAPKVGGQDRAVGEGSTGKAGPRKGGHRGGGGDRRSGGGGSGGGSGSGRSGGGGRGAGKDSGPGRGRSGPGGAGKGRSGRGRESGGKRGPGGRPPGGDRREGGRPGNAGRGGGRRPAPRFGPASGNRPRRDPANPGHAGGGPSKAGFRKADDKPAPPPRGVRLAEVEEVEVEIEKLVAGGDGLGRWEGIPLFIPRAAPGDRLRVRLTDRRPDYGRAEILEILSPGEGRRDAPCPHYERCGGCDLQHLEDDLQTRLKVAAVLETLSRLGGVRLEGPPQVRLDVHTAGHWGYRLRTQLHTRAAATTGAESEDPDFPEIGYYQRGSQDLVPVSVCPILVPELESRIPNLPRDLATAQGPMPRRLDLAAGGRAGGSSNAGEVSVAPVVEGLPHGEIRLTVPLGAKESYDYAFDARCFFQAHRDLVPRLVTLAVGEWIGDVAYDLYAGVGLFALPLAKRYGSVTAVEGDSIAARYARRNARDHDLDIEVEHLALDSWIHRLPKGADRVLVDPPRDGLSTRVRRALRDARPARLTYVSCHSATLARDLQALGDSYRLESLDLLDMFPQTGHMEAVAQLVLIEDEDE